jgi:hypothetical protein
MARVVASPVTHHDWAASGEVSSGSNTASLIGDIIPISVAAGSWRKPDSGANQARQPPPYSVVARPERPRILVSRFRLRSSNRSSRRLSGNDRASLFVGNAGGIDIRVNGKSLGAIGSRGQLTTVLITPEGVNITNPAKKRSRPFSLSALRAEER